MSPDPTAAAAGGDRPVAACFHGFLRTGLSMLPVRAHLQRAGWAQVITPTFLYQAAPLSAHRAHAARLLRALSDAHGGRPVDLVTHSMGGLLARAALAEGAPVHRVVMLAPPNQGAWMAERVRRILPVHHLGWDPLAPLLPGAPAVLPEEIEGVDIGILTGGTGDPRGFWPFVPGDNDGRVRVIEAHLAGARELRVVPFGHATIMARRAVLELVEGFLREGCFPPPAAPTPGAGG
ncbi:hypothetical protein L6R53_19365 [Myxococcota bacterium]|nr:hypothetical protein [Myxococcota bacterium]